MEKNKYTIEIELTAGELRELSDMAGRWNMTTGELLEQFIIDLTDSRRRNGSDEADAANSWYNRNAPNHEADYNSFLTWLIDHPSERVVYSYSSAAARYYKDLPADGKLKADLADEWEAVKNLREIWAAYCEDTSKIEDQAEAFRNADRWTFDRTFLEAEAQKIKD